MFAPFTPKSKGLLEMQINREMSRMVNQTILYLVESNNIR